MRSTPTRFLQEVQGLNDCLRCARPAGAQHGSWPATAGGTPGCNGFTAPRQRYPVALPFVSFENEDVSNHRFERRGLLHTVVSSRAGGATCTACASSLHERGRSRQLEAISAA
jgi:hypothetical protein